MNKILSFTKDYVHHYFHPKLYGIVFIFLAISIAIEYVFNVRETYYDPYRESLWYWPIMFAHQFFPFIFACLAISKLKLKTDFLYQKSFWVFSFFGFTLLGLDQSSFYDLFLNNFLSGYSLLFAERVFAWSISLFTLVIPIIFFNTMVERGSNKNLYGLLMKRFDVTPYLVMLLIAAAILYIGSYWSDIHEYYPRYLHSYGVELASQKEMNSLVPAVIFEAAYASNFISVELFFRGFLILAFTRFLGPYAVIPMVTSYCFLHFGKPIGETISSIFGGYLLGIIALNTRNIWGGILLHIGVAMLMEYFGYLQNT